MAISDTKIYVYCSQKARHWGFRTRSNRFTLTLFTTPLNCQCGPYNLWISLTLTLPWPWAGVINRFSGFRPKPQQLPQLSEREEGSVDKVKQLSQRLPVGPLNYLIWVKSPLFVSTLSNLGLWSAYGAPPLLLYNQNRKAKSWPISYLPDQTHYFWGRKLSVRWISIYSKTERVIKLGPVPNSLGYQSLIYYIVACYHIQQLLLSPRWHWLWKFSTRKLIWWLENI
jgi:hypothetical protein